MKFKYSFIDILIEETKHQIEQIEKKELEIFIYQLIMVIVQHIIMVHLHHQSMLKLCLRNK